MNYNGERISYELQLTAEMVLRAMAAHPRTIRARQSLFMEQVQQILMEYRERIQPRAAIRAIQVREESQGQLLLGNGFTLDNAELCRRLENSESIVAVVATIGDRISRCTYRRTPMHSLILDALGTAAITALVNSIIRDLETEARKHGLNVTDPLYPGMNGWELSQAQTEIFSLVDTRGVGVSLTESFMMTPQKSVSFLVGIGSPVHASQIGCDDCQAVALCRHKAQFYAD